MNFSLKTYPPPKKKKYAAIPHLLVYSRTILVDFLALKVNLNFFRFCPIAEPMISLYKLNTHCARPISAQSCDFMIEVFRNSARNLELLENVHVMCHISNVPCQVGYIYIHFLQTGGAIWWSVCYKWSLPCLFLNMESKFGNLPRHGSSA